MNVTIKTAHGFLSWQPTGEGGPAFLQYRPTAGPWETFDVQGLEWPTPPQPPQPPDPPHGDPATYVFPWPRMMPPDIATVDPWEVADRVDWALHDCNSSDTRSGWVGYVMDTAGEGHQQGWTADDYWRGKIQTGDGVGLGFVSPPK